MFVSVLFLFLDWHERVYKIRVPQSRWRFRTRRGPKLIVLYSRCATLRDEYYITEGTPLLLTLLKASPDAALAL